MISLIKADLYKEVKKKSFKIMLLLIVFVSILSLIVINKSIKLENNIMETYPLLSEEEYKNVNKHGSYQQYVLSYKKYCEFIENNNRIVEKNSNTNLKYILGFSNNFVFLLGIVVIFLAFHSFSYDFQKESLKYVFMSSNSRKKIFFSKFMSITLLTIFLLVFLVLILLITSSLLTRENIFSLKEVVFSKNLIKEVPYLIYYFKEIFIFVLPLFFMIIFTMFLCFIFKGGNFGLIVSCILYFTSLMFSQILFSYGLNFIEYTFLPYLDFTYFSDKTSVLVNNMIYNINLNYNNAFMILGVYSLIFIILTICLLKRDV